MNEMLQTGGTANGTAIMMSQLAATAGSQPPAQTTTAAQPRSQQRIAEPLHIQRLEAALNMRPFMEYARKVLSQPLSSGDDSNATEDDEPQGVDDTDNSDEEAGGTRKKRNRRLGTKEERQSVKMQLLNFSDLTNDREWLYDVLLSDTDTETEISDEDDYVKELLKTHIFEQRHRENFYKKATNTQYAYYGAGMLSNHDMFPEHQQSIMGVRRRRRRTKKEKPIKPPKLPKEPKVRKPRKPKVEQPEPGEIPPSELNNYAFGDTSAVNDEDDNITDDMDSTLDANLSLLPPSGVPHSGRGRRRKSQQARTPEVMAARRRRVWQLMAKKELGRCQRGKANNHKEVLQNCKRVATMCSKVVRQRAMVSQKVMKETVWRAKRLTREMMGYWKRYERVERDTRRRMEREAEEQRKMDVEIIEAKRQQRKLNFLITQTELYAHFMSKKLGQGTEEEQLRILNQLDEEINPRLAAYDGYDADHYKSLAQKNAELAFSTDRDKTRRFDVAAHLKQEHEAAAIKKEEDDDDAESLLPVMPAKADVPQPKMFKGTLKTYQIKGVTWLANLYDQGISGILADEMGLGKTVQSIAFLCHVAEHYGVWGPFLIISPASTLHNWQQEMQRFVPDFNVVPYWGSPNERKILRQFWEQKDLHTRDASFHVVITSYQLIVSDYKYFNRIKWQYMVLDEAQAIKSASSMRWKLLLGFNCRNRLLLSGTPIQNSMAELWALLHFIMPTLFDSHDEFNEWFSKDIESHAENKTGIDEKQISRLHMILKPFMLRRIKKDVENELSDKIEIMVYCPLTIRQKLLYMALKKKIRIEDLLHFTGGGAGSAGDGHHFDKNFTSNLMNLVMQFRKVCNHPELFERRDAKSPFAMRCEEYVLPRLVYGECLLQRAMPSKRHLLYNSYSIFKAAYLHKTLFSEPLAVKAGKSNEQYARYVDLNASDSSCFSFTRLCDLSPRDMEDVTINGLISYILHYRRRLLQYDLLAYRRQWWPHYKSTRFQLLEPLLENPLQPSFMLQQSVLRNFLFTGVTSRESTVYSFGSYKTMNIQETIEHRVIRSKYIGDSKLTAAHLHDSLSEDLDIKAEYDLESSVEVPSKSHKCTSKHKADVSANAKLLPEFRHVPRTPTVYQCEALEMPRFLYGLGQRVQAVKRNLYCESRDAAWSQIRHLQCENSVGLELVNTALDLCRPRYGWSSIVVPDKQTLVSDAGKLAVLDSLLTRLKAQGHRVLIYSQMTKMIDLLEEYMWHRKHRYMRLDGSSKISARRDMVADFQTREDIFVFLLSTRAGGLGINLTAADTVIFYDSDWNPTVDQQAMDRAHRLGQTKQVTVYRLICKGTIEERILQRAREKSEIQRMVISGGNFKPDTLKPKEVVSLLLDDEEIEIKYRQKVDPDAASSSQNRDVPGASNDKKRQRNPNKQSQQPGGITIPAAGGGVESTIGGDSPAMKRSKLEASAANDDDSIDVAATSGTSSPSTSAATAIGGNMEPFVPGATTVMHNDDSDNEALIVDCESPLHGAESPTLFGDYGNIGRIRRRHHPRGTKRGRPRGSTRRGGGNGTMGRSLSSPGNANVTTPGTPGGEDAAHSTSLTNLGAGETSFTSTVPTPVKRGPGRPRLKTAGPTYQGTRGTPRTRKPIGPLVVPLGHSPGATPMTRSPAVSRAPSPSFSERSSYSATGVAISTSQASGSSGTTNRDVGSS
ncbi:chromatin-remodeling ATPase INO80 isoform X1 [Zeugodacus cucurbitae]|uniref:chromatin-remodeling ATPase INO80 isoform X1 n=1 Tax=Zeugodacus cucurbitae TaxID=28588 RepID=UPI000596A456|nr:chromatin-remodeling ATPase INO80 isoform X1 [Zeugodacus cucurbitae]